MRKITDFSTKCLLVPAALFCMSFLISCQGTLGDEDLELKLLQAAEKNGISLIEDDDDNGSGTNSASALVGTWLDVDFDHLHTPGSGYIGGFIFMVDGTVHCLDEAYRPDGTAPGHRNIAIGKIGEEGPTNEQLQILVNTVKAEPADETWTVSGNIITLTEKWVDPKSAEVEIDIDRMKYVLSGNTLMLYSEYDEDDGHSQDEDGDGWEDEPEWILTKYNF